MSFSELDWGFALRRAGYVLALWVGLWLLRRLIVKRIPRLVARFVAIELDGRDAGVLTWATDIVLLLIGLMGTVSILDLAPLLVIGTIGSRLIALIIVWLLVWLLVRYLNIWIQALDRRLLGFELDPRELVTLDRLLDIGLILVGLIISLAILGLTPLLYSALTAAGVFGIIVGFAVKDIAANFISGLFILIDRPFVIGDTIKVKEITGTVIKISLRSTQLVTLDGPAVTIPNSMVAVEPTTNFTVSQYRRILFVISVLSSVDLDRTIQIISQTLDAEHRLLADHPPSIYVDRIRDYIVDLQITAYTSAGDLFDTQSDLKKAVTAALAAHGIELALPVQVSYVANTPAPPPLTGRPQPSATDGQEIPSP